MSDVAEQSPAPSASTRSGLEGRWAAADGSSIIFEGTSPNYRVTFSGQMTLEGSAVLEGNEVKLSVGNGMLTFEGVLQIQGDYLVGTMSGLGFSVPVSCQRA